MAKATLEHVTRLADQLTREEQHRLIEHLSRQVEPEGVNRVTTSGLTGKQPQSLRGIGRGHFPEDLDIDAILHKIRHDWEKEWPDVFGR